MIWNILLTGIGGQGVVTAAGFLRWSILAAGYRLAGQDNRGGAQRLGHVSAIVRFSDDSDRPISPEIPDGACHLLLSLEASEGLRFSSALSKVSVVIHSTRIVIPTNQRRARLPYVSLEQCQEVYRSLAGKVISLDPDGLAATNFGRPVLGNLIVLGLGIKLAAPAKLSRLLETQLEGDSLQAFRLGLELGEKEPL